MLQLNHVHHIAIICSDYERSKYFYTEILGLKIIREVHRAERDSYKLDLELNGQYIIELFSFPNPPARPSRPEALGLRHLAFAVSDVEAGKKALETAGIETEPIRTDTHTGRRFTFSAIPTGCRWSCMKRKRNDKCKMSNVECKSEGAVRAGNDFYIRHYSFYI